MQDMLSYKQFQEVFEMFDLNIFSNLSGIPLNPSDLRPLTDKEISNLQYATAHLTQQADFGPNYWLQLSNSTWPLGRSVPEKPLDERFADFKIRLASARSKCSRERF